MRWSPERPPRRGDLVLTGTHYYGLITAMEPGDRAVVRLADGLVVTLGPDEYELLGLGPYRGQDGGLAMASFAEEMRPGWADPQSPEYCPPPPVDQEGRRALVLDGGDVDHLRGALECLFKRSGWSRFPQPGDSFWVRWARGYLVGFLVKLEHLCGCKGWHAEPGVQPVEHDGAGASP
jgi:hypothetical protein